MKKQIKPTVCGVGINDSDYPTSKWETYTDEKGDRKERPYWKCPFYERWRNMLQRCYYKPYQDKTPSYKGCSVCEDWLTFSAFKAWMESQEWEGQALDKDILVPGNKVYCPERCMFVSQETNRFILEVGRKGTQYPIGCVFDKWTGRYSAKISLVNKEGLKGKINNLGRYDTPEEAHWAWLNEKRKQAVIMAERQTDPRVAEALIDRYENYHKYFPMWPESE